MPVEHPACTGGAGVTEEEISDQEGSQAPEQDGEVELMGQATSSRAGWEWEWDTVPSKGHT